jgi:hypothetical protein
MLAAEVGEAEACRAIGVRSAIMRRWCAEYDSAQPERGRSPFVELERLFAGDCCPEYQCGRVYKYRPSEFTTVSGQSPLVVTRHTVEALQCNLCKAVFKAPLPEVLEADGIQERTLYSYSAIAIVCTYRFFAGMPMHRQERVGCGRLKEARDPKLKPGPERSGWELSNYGHSWIRTSDFHRVKMN